MKLFLYFFLILYLVSCTSNTIYKKPKDLIPKDTMIFLLTDLYIANSAKVHRNEKLEININYTPLVYIKYKIDSLRFIKSNTYYISKLEGYEKIFKQVQNRLLKLQKKYEKKEKKQMLLKEKKQKVFKDSIKKIVKYR